MPSSPTRLQDFQTDFSGGVDSDVVTTIASPQNPNGLQRNQCSWLINATVRTGAIWPRTGWRYVTTIGDGTKPYQLGFLYDQNVGNPYLISVMGGHVFQTRLDTDNSTVDLSLLFGQTMPVTPRCFFRQAEQYLVIQAGDFGLVPSPTLPLFWDGTTLRRSNGITGNLSGPSINEIPAATCMVYYMNRLWYAQGRNYSAGDIFGGATGTTVLTITENPLALAGDGFRVPTNAGGIRALDFTANLDTSLGQGPLFVFTRKQVYQLIVPITRTDWIAATSSNLPLQTVAQITNGSVNDTSVVAVNGDLFYQTLLPSINSLISAIRYYQQWGNTPISKNENRLLAFNNRDLLNFSSGIEFDNRLLQTALPTQTPQGVVHNALIPLEFDVISSFDKKLPPVWEGSYEGLKFMQLFTGDYGGRQRAFAVVLSDVDSSIQVWEITDAEKFDMNLHGEARITWQVETPSYTFGDLDQLKELDTVQFWFDRIFGSVVVNVSFRPDSDACWHDWKIFKLCAARNSAEAGEESYPVVEFCEQDQRPVTLSKAPAYDCNLSNHRPINIGYSFQLRITVKGFCRLRSIRVFALPKEQAVYSGIVC